MWGGAEDILNFGGEVSLEGSLPSDSRDESSSEDDDGIIGCNGLRCISRRGQTQKRTVETMSTVPQKETSPDKAGMADNVSQSSYLSRPRGECC